ncbi:MAG: hypothetical protein ABR989_16325, partial [Candidatus Binatus soli]
HASILRISSQNAVSIFHHRCATQPTIVANPSALGDYDDHQPDLIQSKTKKGQFGRGGGCARAGRIR